MTKASMLGNRRRLRRHSCLSGGHASAEAVALPALELLLVAVAEAIAFGF